MEDNQQDICRVCRSEGTQERPLYHPCICTGSIKFIHQECLLQWLKYSKKEYCELCKHRFIFTPIYSPDMPKRLPIKDIVSGLLTSIATAVRYWLHYTLVAFAWLGIVPLMACRIYRCLFTGSVSSLLTLPLDMLSTDHLLTDCIQGCFIVMCTLCAFISLVWLREQILHGGAPEWLMPFDGDGQDQNGNVAAAVNGAAQAGNGQAQAGNVPAVAENVAAQPNAAIVNNGDDNQDDNNWNPIEWDRAGEELTWERLLGLDGSLVFLEHVFWVISLNTLFILVFAFCPYHIGHFTIVGFKLQEYLVVSSFEGLLTTLIGYLLIAFILVLIHTLASITNILKIKGIIGMCYIVVKVSLLVVIEIGMFPLMCGWWLDICSLPLFDASLNDRLTNFKAAPGTTMFVHWLVGMVYVFYFASFILLLREVLRPGVLWFLRNLNDPNFNPIQEMIHLPTHRHCRRIIASMVLFGSTVLVMLWLPVLFIKAVFTSFLPYHVSLPSDAPVSELSLELLLLQVILPALLEQSHTRQWMKKLVKLWCTGVSLLLNLRSYLLGDIPVTEENVINGNEPVQHIQPLPPIEGLQGLGAEHQAILQGGGPTGFQPYNRPTFFAVRVLLLILLLLATLFVCSTVCLIIPVWTGRQVMAIWMGDTSIHELYTAACGLYVCWIVLRCGGLLYSWLPRGADVIYNKLKEWFLLLFKSVIAAAVLVGLVPLLLGCLFEQVVVAPVRVPLNQTPIYFPWQDWALGVLHLKILCAMTMMGPNWWLKQVIEQVYNDGFRNMNLSYILRRLCLPVTVCLGLALAVPYVSAHSIVPLLGGSDELQHVVQRRIYPSCLLAILFTAIFIFQAKQFKKLYEHIKNDKYLVGQRLVNYERRVAAERRAAQETAR